MATVSPRLVTHLASRLRRRLLAFSSGTSDLSSRYTFTMPNTSNTRSATCRRKWRELSATDRASRVRTNSDARRKWWASLSPEERQSFIDKAATGRRQSPTWGAAVAVSRYKRAGVPDDEIDALMSMDAANRKWARKRWVLYGVRPSDVSRLIERQKGRCVLCERDLPTSFHVDHDHETGRLRGLLCVSCNLLLGRLEKSGRAWVDRAFSYVTNAGRVTD